MPVRIGVDFGGVLTSTTTPVGEVNPQGRPKYRAKEVIAEWVESGHEVFLISKADNPEKEDRIRSWLWHYGFDHLFAGETYGDRNHFCRDRESKVALCRDHGIQIMIDDTSDQLRLLEGVVPVRILFGAAYGRDGMLPAVGWNETRAVVERAIANALV